MDGVTLECGGLELLDLVGPLWEQLRGHHARASAHFREAIEAVTFDERRASVVEKAAAGPVRVELARQAESGACVGYCIATIDARGAGEVDSLFVAEPWRGRGIGSALLGGALGWMDDHSANPRRLGVMAGNERAFAFYARFGFRPRTTILEQPPDARPDFSDRA